MTVTTYSRLSSSRNWLVIFLTREKEVTFCLRFLGLSRLVRPEPIWILPNKHTTENLLNRKGDEFQTDEFPSLTKCIR